MSSVNVRIILAAIIGFTLACEGIDNDDEFRDSEDNTDTETDSGSEPDGSDAVGCERDGVTYPEGYTIQMPCNNCGNYQMCVVDDGQGEWMETDCLCNEETCDIRDLPLPNSVWAEIPIGGSYLDGDQCCTCVERSNEYYVLPTIECEPGPCADESLVCKHKGSDYPLGTFIGLPLEGADADPRACLCVETETGTAWECRGAWNVCSQDNPPFVVDDLCCTCGTSDIQGMSFYQATCVPGAC